MKKLILSTFLVGPAALFGATEFQCFTDAPGKKTHVTVQLHFKEMTVSGKLFTRAQVEVAGSKVEKHCVVFEIEKRFNRIGFVQTYLGRLPNAGWITLEESSLSNEGPAEFRKGSLKLDDSGAVVIPLSCVKKSP